MSAPKTTIFFHPEADELSILKLSGSVALQFRPIGTVSSELSIFLDTKAGARALIEVCQAALEELPETIPGYDQLTLAEVMPGALAELEGY